MPKEEGPNASCKDSNGTEAEKHIRVLVEENGVVLEADIASILLDSQPRLCEVPVR